MDDVMAYFLWIRYSPALRTTRKHYRVQPLPHSMTTPTAHQSVVLLITTKANISRSFPIATKAHRNFQKTIVGDSSRLYRRAGEFPRSHSGQAAPRLTSSAI